MLVSSFLLTGLLLAGVYLLWNNQRPAALLQQGIRLEQQKKLPLALHVYQRLFENYTGHSEAADALYRSGQILQHDLGEYQRALLRYLQLEKNYPQNSFVVRAQQEAAELTKYRMDDCGQAIPIYQRLVERSGQEGDLSLYEIADCYIREENWSQAGIEFETFLSSYPQSELYEKVLYRLADALSLSGQRDQARSKFEQVVSRDPKSSQAQEARFRLAEMLEEDEHLKEALHAYSKLTGYPRQALLKRKIKNLKERMARKKKVL